MLLANILGIGSLDLQYINELLEVLADEQCGYDIREELKQTGISFEDIDANAIIFPILDRINREIFNRIAQQIEEGTIAISDYLERRALLNLCQKRIDEFSPYLNCLDSHFNNELDDIGVRGNTLSRIVDKVIPLLRENVRS